MAIPFFSVSFALLRAGDSSPAARLRWGAFRCCAVLLVSLNRGVNVHIGRVGGKGWGDVLVDCRKEVLLYC